jgi:hypothetical protein
MLLIYWYEVDQSSPNSVLGVPFFSEVIAVRDVHQIAVYVDVLSHNQVLWFVYLSLVWFVRSSF